MFKYLYLILETPENTRLTASCQTTPGLATNGPSTNIAQQMLKDPPLNDSMDEVIIFNNLLTSVYLFFIFAIWDKHFIIWTFLKQFFKRNNGSGKRSFY